MAYKDIKAGKYLAKPISGAFGKSKKKNTPQVGIEFRFNAGTKEAPVMETIWWVGYLTEDAKERAFDTLAMIGFNGDESFGPGTFNKEAEVELVIEMETYEGKTHPRVTWVNMPGGSKFSNLEPKEVKSMLVTAGIDIKKEMAAARAKKGIKEDKPAEKAPF